MKFTVAFIALLSISSVFTKRVDEQKDKREAAPSYPSTSGHYPSSQSAVSYQNPSAYQQSSYQPQQSIGGYGDAASSINVGAGYSIGGAKPSFSYGGSGLEGLQSSGQSIKLAPITLQPNQGLVGTDLAQIMSQLQHSLNSGALTLQPSSNVAEFHVDGQAGQDSHGQLNYGSPNLQQYVLAGSVPSAPSYAAGTKGLSSYGSGTGPVLFSPSTHAVAQGILADQSLSGLGAGQSHGEASPLGIRQSFGLTLGSGLKSSDGIAYGGPSGLSLGGHSYGSGISLGSAGPSISGISLEGTAGHSFGSSGQNLGSSALSHNFGHSLGAAQPQGSIYKLSSGKYGHGGPGKSFRPSPFLGSVASSGETGISGISQFPSFSALSGNHGHSFAGYGSPSKAISPLFTRTDGHPVHDSAPAYSNVGNFASPPATTYGFPTASYPAESAQAASSAGPQYYSAKFPSHFKSHFSYKGASPYSSGPKYLSGGHGHGPSARYSSSEDSNGAYSENAYNTIKYSEELKPRN